LVGFATTNSTPGIGADIVMESITLIDQRSKRSIKRNVKKKALPRPEGEKILSRDPAHFTVRVPLDFARGFASELSSIPREFHHPVITTPIES
jgi:hypothetical protein